MSKKRGRPKDVSSPIVDKDDPGNYPTLLRFLEAKGRVKHINYVHMMRARHLYLKGSSSQHISEHFDGAIEPAIIDRWALMFSWDEERDRRLFEQFRSATEKPYGGDLSKRHERIAGGIEQYAEKLLLAGQNGTEDIKARDLATLASTIKATQEIRRTARGENVDKSERNVHIQIGMPSAMEKIAGALMDMHDPPKLELVKTRTISVGTEDGIGSDTEYEEALDGQTETSE